MVRKLHSAQTGAYTFRQKAAAFCKGLVRKQPLVEVALTGLKQSGLSEFKQNEYALRVVRKGSRDERTALSAFEALKSGAVTSHMAQDKLAHVFRAWHEQTKRELDMHPARTERGLVDRRLVDLTRRFKLGQHLDAVATLAQALVSAKVLASAHALAIFIELGKTAAHEDAVHNGAHQSAAGSTG